jgi:hypothetical protein
MGDSLMKEVRFEAEKCEGIVKDCKLYATNCVIIGEGNILRGGTTILGDVFCEDCRHYIVGWVCGHERNTKWVTTPERRKKTHIHATFKINFDNVCSWYEPK